MAKSKQLVKPFVLQSVKSVITEFDYNKFEKEVLATKGSGMYGQKPTEKHLEFFNLFKKYLEKYKDDPAQLREAANVASQMLWERSSETFFRRIEEEITSDLKNHEFKFKPNVKGNLVVVKKTGMHGIFEKSYNGGTKLLLLHRAGEVVDVGSRELVCIGSNLFEFYVALTGYSESEHHTNPYKCIEAVNSHSDMKRKIETLTNDYTMPVKEVVKLIKPYVLECLQGI